jgi:hypothetical protein
MQGITAFFRNALFLMKINFRREAPEPNRLRKDWAI